VTIEANTGNCLSRVAQKLNLAGNEHTAKARELRSQESNGTPDEETGRSKKNR
jgi:hypothetical protein